MAGGNKFMGSLNPGGIIAGVDKCSDTYSAPDIKLGLDCVPLVLGISFRKCLLGGGINANGAAVIAHFGFCLCGLYSFE